MSEDVQDGGQLEQIVVAGSRSIEDPFLGAYLTQLTAGGANRGVYEIISGGAHGVDQAAKEWAERYDCPYMEFEITEDDWNEHGKAAGPIRNREMAEYAAPDGILVAVWDGESNGTESMIEAALDHGLEVHVYQEES